MKRRIVMLFHELQRPYGSAGYSVSNLYPFWREDGHEVVEVYGVDQEVPGDLLFLHVDLSEVPEPYLDYAARYPASINGKVRNIRKTASVDYLVRRGDPWQGPVIVKSDRNYGGIPEAVFGIPRLDGKGSQPAFRSPMDYKVYDSVREMPEEIFDCPDLVVQRFLPEYADGRFHIRTYSFLGEAGRCLLTGSNNPIVKARTKETAWKVEVHPAILARRVQLGLDFGKLDYVVRDGEAILLDANKTVGDGAFKVPDPVRARDLGNRARALYPFFR